MITPKGKWTVTKARIRKRGRTRRKRTRYVLRLRDPWEMELIAYNFSARKIREFADAATDALDGCTGTVHGWGIERTPRGLKLTRGGMYIDSPRDVFTDLIAQVDHLLED